MYFPIIKLGHFECGRISNPALGLSTAAAAATDNVQGLLHHGRWDCAAVLNGGQRRCQVGRIGGFYNLLVPIDHVQVTVELLPDFFG